MSILSNLPTYHQVEPNNLKGLQAGFVVAQAVIASSAEADLLNNGMFENGHICALNSDGEIIKATGTETALFIHYTEPLNTFIKGDKYFAVNPANELGRLVQLIPGDEWTSTMDPTDVLIAGRIIQIQGSDGWFGMDHMPDGTTAYHYMFLG